MGSRPRSPSAYPADARGAQAGGPGPAKRRRTEESASPGWEAASSLGELTAAPPSGSLTSVVVLATGCALYLALDDMDLLLQPEPTSMLEVSVGDRTLTLVPEALVDSDVQLPWGQGLEQVAVLSAPGESIALEQGFFCLAVPEISDQEGADEEQEEEGEEEEGEEEGEEEEAAAAADAEFLPPGMEAAAGSVAGLGYPAGRLSGQTSRAGCLSPGLGPPSLVGREVLLSTTSTWTPTSRSPSQTQALLPSPCPGPQERPQRPQRPHGPHPKARRRLILK